MKYEIIDNALSSQDSYQIKTTITSPEMPWFYQPIVASENEEKNINQYYFTHTFYKNYSWTSHWAERFINPILSVLNAKSLIRIKANFYPRAETRLENGMHSDQPFSHRGAIYYVNSNDGFTVLEDGTKIESVENRILLFDSSLPHRSTHCTDNHGRININFNFF